MEKAWSFDIDLVWLVVILFLIVSGYLELKFTVRQTAKDLAMHKRFFDEYRKDQKTEMESIREDHKEFEEKIFGLLTDIQKSVSNIEGRISKD